MIQHPRNKRRNLIGAQTLTRTPNMPSRSLRRCTLPNTSPRFDDLDARPARDTNTRTTCPSTRLRVRNQALQPRRSCAVSLDVTQIPYAPPPQVTDDSSSHARRCSSVAKRYEVEGNEDERVPSDGDGHQTKDGGLSERRSQTRGEVYKADEKRT